MSEWVYVVSVLLLGAVIVFQMMERAKVLDQYKEKEDKLLEENSRLVKAVIAKNANDYVMTTSIDKVASDEKPKEESDLIPEDNLSDEDFMAAINKTVKR